MNKKSSLRFRHGVLPAFLLAVSVGQIYAFTNFATEIATCISSTQKAVQFAFSLGIFFLGMGAAFFGKIVEKNIRVSTFVGTGLFLAGLATTSLGIDMHCLPLIYLGYGVLVGAGTGIIYISPVKTMMLWFPANKAIAAALPIISFGLGSTLSTIMYKGFSIGGPESIFYMRFLGFADIYNVAADPAAIAKVFRAFAVFYAVPMIAASLLLKKPRIVVQSFGHDLPQLEFKYIQLAKDPFFLRSWLFMFLNISAGLCLIPLAKQMMSSPAVGYPDGLATAVIAFCGLMNGGGRFLFAWWSDRLEKRLNILVVILAISLGVMLASFWPLMIGLALLVINACYGAGFSVIPAILADHYGMTNISKIHGAVLSAWGFAGLAGNQAAILVSKFGGQTAVVAMLVAVYALNLWNVRLLGKTR